MDRREQLAFEVKDEKGTVSLARAVATLLDGKSACIELVGDVGVGKTTFTKALVEALGSDDEVSSPTFTLENIYETKNNTVHHFDLYRLAAAGLLPEEVSEALQSESSIVIIEWADIINQTDILPKDRIIIEFRPQAESETARRVLITSSRDFLVTVPKGSES